MEAINCATCGKEIVRHESGRGRVPKYCDVLCKRRARNEWARSRPSLRDRFMEKVTTSDTGCWIWNASRIGDYGQFYYQGRMQGAHRVSYMLHVGPIPDGLVIDHKCSIRCCVNPEHLEAVTQQQNALRGNNPGRRVTHCPAGHEYTPENTYVGRARNGRTSRSCRKCRRLRERKPDGYIAKRVAACSCKCCDH